MAEAALASDLLPGRGSLSDVDVRMLLGQLGKLQQDRGLAEAEWREVSEHLRPIRAELSGSIDRPKRSTTIFDSTGPYAARNMAGGIYGAMTNPASRWFELQADSIDIQADRDGRAWFELVSQRVLATFGPSFSSFYAQVCETFEDLVVLGSAPFYSSHKSGTARFVDLALSVWECFPVFTDDGQLDQMFRLYRASALSLVRRFGRNVPDKVAKLASDNPGARLRVLHVVRPNPEQREGGLGPAAMPFQSVHLLIDEAEGHVLGVGGYWSMPFMYPRWSVPASDIYGQGPGFSALTDAKVLNAAEKSNLQIMRRNADPPLLAPDKGVISVLRTGPGGVSFGGITRRGERLVAGLDTGARPSLQLEISNQKREAIKDAFFWTVMQLVGRTGMSATEVMERSEEKGRLMGPAIGRVQSELLAPLVMGRFEALWRAGQLPDPPPSIQGAGLTIEYTSPLAKAQKSLQATSTMRLLQSTAEMAQVFPDVLDRIDTDAALDILQDGFGAPSSVLLSIDVAQQRRQDRQAQQQAAQQMAALEQGAGIAAKAGQAISTMGLQPDIAGAGTAP